MNKKNVLAENNMLGAFCSHENKKLLSPKMLEILRNFENYTFFFLIHKHIQIGTEVRLCLVFLLFLNNNPMFPLLFSLKSENGKLLY